MDYEKMAAELIDARYNAQRVATDRKVGKILHGEAFALNFLFNHNNIAYPRELSAAMNVSTARIARLLNKLESENKIVRTPDPKDCRQILVTITQEGIAFVKEHKRRGVCIFSELLEKLGEEDAKEYVRINKKIADILMQNFNQK